MKGRKGLRIIIVGCGSIGYTIARELVSQRNMNITIIDSDADILEQYTEALDVKVITGSGVDEEILREAGAKDADLIVTTTEADEVNILSCIMAKHLGTQYAVARVRDPIFSSDYYRLW